jgi:hypothetical protein
MRIPEAALGFLIATALWALFGALTAPDAFVTWLYKWQTLLGAIIAALAIFAAVNNTTRAIRHADSLETRRRMRKHAALRAVLPLALADVTNYAQSSARALQNLLTKCEGGKLPPNTIQGEVNPQLPSNALTTLTDFIEYSDTIDVGVLEATVAWIQIHEARLREMARGNNDPSGSRLIVPTEIGARIIDAASIYAGAAAVFEYARRQQNMMPATVTWDNVLRALRNMQFWEGEYPNLHQIVAERQKHTAGPFERL